MCARHDVTQSIAEEDLVDHARKQTEAALQTRKSSVNEISTNVVRFTARLCTRPRSLWIPEHATF